MQYNKCQWKNWIFLWKRKHFSLLIVEKTLNQVTLKMLKQNTLNSYTSSIIYFKSAQNYIWQMIYKNTVIFIIQFFQSTYVKAKEDKHITQKISGMRCKNLKVGILIFENEYSTCTCNFP